MSSATRKRPFDTSVFVNCPFDDGYQPQFRALVFVIEYCGFGVRCALEADDSGETRAEKLLRIIAGSQYGIHDISRTESNAEGLPRFNMPYEFGLFVGFKAGGIAKQAKKVVLVLDREKYRYQQFLSDIAGQDIRAHANAPNILIREVRNWLQNQTTRQLHGAEHIAARYRVFGDEIPSLLALLRKTPTDLENFYDYHRLVCDWVSTELVAGLKVPRHHAVGDEQGHHRHQVHQRPAQHRAGGRLGAVRGEPQAPQQEPHRHRQRPDQIHPSGRP